MVKDYSYYKDLVSRPGKFEGEEPYIPYFYELAMDGRQDQVEYVGDVQVDVFEVGREDAQLFPELEYYVGMEIAIAIDDQGFVYEVDLDEVDQLYEYDPGDVWDIYTGGQSVDEFLRLFLEEGITHVEEACELYVADLPAGPDIGVIDVDYIARTMEEYIRKVVSPEELREMGFEDWDG